MWARINGDRVAEITEIDPDGRFHKSVKWVECGAEVIPGWSYDGEQCTPPPIEQIGDLAERKRTAIDEARDNAFAAGLPYDIAGTPDVVQTRPQDQINLLGLAAKAQRLIAVSDTTTQMPFRGLSNETYHLDAEQMDALALAALAHIENIYQRSWDRKDAITAALEADDRAAIEAVEW